MKAFKKVAIAAAFLVFAASAMIVSAQGPVQKRIDFTINTPFEINQSKAILPAGSYILLQVYPNNPDVFSLYQGNLMHSPIATVQTARIDYGNGRYPHKTKMLVKSDEEADMDIPIISGWTIPGMDGWQILQTVLDRSRVTTVATAKAQRMTEQVQITAIASGF